MNQPGLFVCHANSRHTKEDVRPLFVCAIAVLILVATTSSAAEVLDQQNDVSPSATADSTSGGVLEQGQTFTVGVTGTLSRIAVQINFPGFGSGGNAILNVYNTSDGMPTGASLGTASLPSSGIPSIGYVFQSFDLSSSAIPVHAGDVFAYSISSTADSYFFSEIHSTIARMPAAKRSGAARAAHRVRGIRIRRHTMADSRRTSSPVRPACLATSTTMASSTQPTTSRGAVTSATRRMWPSTAMVMV